MQWESETLIVGALCLLAAWVVVTVPWESAVVCSTFLAWTHYACLKQTATVLKLATVWGCKMVCQRVKSKYLLLTAPPTGNNLPGSKSATGVVMRRPRCAGASAALS